MLKIAVAAVKYDILNIISFLFFFFVLQLFSSIPVGIGQVYGCDNAWTGGIFMMALFISSPITLAHATIGSAVGMVSGKCIRTFNNKSHQH